MAGKGNRIRCPQCGGFGSSKNVDGLCKKCGTEKWEEAKRQYTNELAVKRVIKSVTSEERKAPKICTKCGEPAYKYLDASGYHSWYCEFHYNEKIEELKEENNQPPSHIVRDHYLSSGYINNTDPLPVIDKVPLIKEQYDLER